MDSPRESTIKFLSIPDKIHQPAQVCSMSARGCDRENMALQGVIFSSVMSAFISPVQTLTEIRCSSLLKTDHRSCENYTKTGTDQTLASFGFLRAMKTDGSIFFHPTEKERPPYLVFNVDAAPGIFPAPVHLASGRVGDGHVGANHGEWHPLPHPVVLRLHLRHGEVVDLDLVLLQLEQDLK